MISMQDIKSCMLAGLHFAVQATKLTWQAGLHSLAEVRHEALHFTRTNTRCVECIIRTGTCLRPATIGMAI